MRTGYCCDGRHSPHHWLLHRKHTVLAVGFWMLLLAGIPAGLAAELWRPLGPPLFLTALGFETWLLRRLTRHA